MNVLLLSVAVIAISAQHVLKKYYNGRVGGRGAYIYNAVAVLCTCFFFLAVAGFRLNFDSRILPYAALFGVGYGVALITSFIAIKLGILSLTSLISSFSLIIPTVYGLVFLNESAKLSFYIGLALLLVSLFLINSKKAEAKITTAWVISIALCFFGNGFCTTVQNVQQREFLGEYKSELMIISLGAVALVLFAMAFLTERGEIKECVVRGGHLMALCGIANGTANFVIMMLALRMSASLMFPIISAGGIILTWAVSRFLYKEKLTTSRNIALILGIAAVVLMNI